MWKKCGYTLLEAIIVVGLMSALFLIAVGSVLTVMRIAKREQAIVQMDQDANRAMETIKHTLLSGYIPVAETPLITGRKGALDGTSFDNNVGRWRDVLGNGTDLFVFLVGVDIEGDGDILYGSSQESKRLILGIQSNEHSAAVPNGMREATDEGDTLSNLGIIDLNPISHMGLSSNNSSDIDITAARFATPFVFPTPSGGRTQIYGVIRFVPFRQNNTAFLLNEGQLGQDLNNDGDTNDEFALGHLEIVYPASNGNIITHGVSGDSVLLQINRNDSPQDSLFQLWPRDTDGNNIKVHLLMCNYLEQQAPWAFGFGGNQIITRSYETLLQMPLMTAE